MGFEVVVRPAVLPNIRPSTPRVMAPPDNPESGICTLSGGSGKFVNTVYSWSVSVSRSMPQVETRRQVDVERVYQVDDRGNSNKNNFVDVEPLRKVRLDSEKGPVKVIYGKPPPRANVERLETGRVIIPEDTA